MANIPVGISAAVAAAVLGSALLHATWNALAKTIDNRLVASGLIGVGFLVGGAVWTTMVTPPAGASWPYLIVSAALQTGYLLLLTAAYAHGDFGRIYPLARGCAPIIVTAFSLIVLDERLGVGPLIGIALVAASLGVLVPMRQWRGNAGVALALATGAVIACYTLVDGIGVRQSGTAAGYAAWQMLIHGPLAIAACLVLSGRRAVLDAWRHRAALLVAHRATVLRGLAGGFLSMAAYAVVLWAQSRASLSLVSTLRETSVLFAGVLGAVLFRERLTARQTVAAAGVVAGIAVIQLV